MPTEPLTDAEERLWGDWVRLNAEMSMARQHDQSADGLSAPDLDVLVQLAGDADGRRRPLLAVHAPR